MAQTPKRPISLRFVLGKGQVKRRRESEDTTRAVVEQATISFAENAWEQVRTRIRDRIEKDVRAELVHTAGAFRRNVIGAPGSQRGLVGTLTTVSKGQFQEKQSLGSLPRWAPRGAKYLKAKQKTLGHIDWFDNSTWTKGRRAVEDSGTLRDFFASDVIDTPGGGDLNVGSGGVFEDVFGGISVQVTKNNVGWGVNQGSIKFDSKGHNAQVQLATIRVRALGKVTDQMLALSDQSNRPLLAAFEAAGEREVALHLRGGKGRYRPTLEPYLKFFLQRAIPAAVTERIRRASTDGSLFRPS